MSLKEASLQISFDGVSDDGVQHPIPETLPLVNPAAVLVDDLYRVKEGGHVWIFTGAAHDEVYTRDFINAAAEIKGRRSAQIHISTGPVIITNEWAFSGLLYLKDQGTIDLQPRPNYGAIEHFRVVETPEGYRYYAERLHSPSTPLDKRRVENLGRYNPHEIFRLAQTAINVFETQVNLARSDSALRPQLSLIHRYGLAQLVAEANVAEQDLSFLDLDQIMKLPSARHIDQVDL